MTEIICTFITAAAGIVVAILTAHIKKTDARNERRAEVRQQEQLLSMRMSDATLQLSLIMANSLRESGLINGNVDNAKQAAEDAAHEYAEMMREITARQVGK